MKKTYQELLNEEITFIIEELYDLDYEFSEGRISAQQAADRIKRLANSTELDTALENAKNEAPQD